MDDTAVRAERLGKCYRLGQPQTGDVTLREVVAARAAGAVRAIVGGEGPAGRGAELLWAIRDLSFEVPRGEVLGVIGSNGAGKSTLLKVLARVTSPTLGRATIRGRLGSLLEVGTGFHPELSGRENVYLNGAILGMRRDEIRRKFDEIVTFAEVERFIDTPVKRYSSGMYLRLAFAVAAHLEPEILLVDEVLAVGDAAFQRKCLGKMGDVARHGRTVLFVSHNMDAIARLCPRTLLLERGGLAADGPSTGVIARYLSRTAARWSPAASIDLTSASRVGTGEARVVGASYRSDALRFDGHPFTGGPVRFRVVIDSEQERVLTSVAVSIRTLGGTKLVNADIIAQGRELRVRRGRTEAEFRIRELHLNAGTYAVGLYLGDAVGDPVDFLEHAFEIEVLPVESEGLGMTPANALVPCAFDFTEIESAPHTVGVAGTEAPHATDGGLRPQRSRSDA